MSPGPVSDFIDVPLEGFEGFGNMVEVQDVAKVIVVDKATEEQLNFMPMGAAMATDSTNNNELGTEVNWSPTTIKKNYNLNDLNETL